MKLNEKKKIAVLGSTGSIGTQALEVISENPSLFEAYALTAGNNVDLLIQQARKFKPEFVVIGNDLLYLTLKEALNDLPIKVYVGMDAIAQVAEMDSVDIVLTAMVGYAGLKPTLAALKAGKKIALANKETMVVAGELVNKLAIDNNASIIPVDSEHSAIFQCLSGEFENPIEKILLTASGGPFRTWSLAELSKATSSQALKHPNWTMGAKITIDSATLMNKGFEVIEAKWLFDVPASKIEVVVHPQSIIHSMVQFEDGSIKAQLGLPDMKLPIQYAFSYPNRIKNNYPRLSFEQYSNFTFEKPDTDRFRNLGLAFESMEKGGNMPCILNAANEVVVDAFLNEKVGFLQMSDLIVNAMQRVNFISQPSYEDLVQTDLLTREFVSSIIPHK